MLMEKYEDVSMFSSLYFENVNRLNDKKNHSTTKLLVAIVYYIHPLKVIRLTRAARVEHGHSDATLT